MKTLITLIVLMSLSTQAQSLRSLKGIMSDMGSTLKSITMAIQSGNISPKTVADAETFVKQIIEAEAITPDTVLSLPRVDQDAAKAKYDQEMKAMEKNATDLANALKVGNVDQAKQILVQLGADKKQGHKDFK